MTQAEARVVHKCTLKEEKLGAVSGGVSERAGRCYISPRVLKAQFFFIVQLRPVFFLALGWI